MRSILIVFLTVLSCELVVTAEPAKVTIALNWVPEPEFGGIYEAQRNGVFTKNGLEVEIKPGGSGAPTWQRVATGKADFAVSSADEVVIARSNGADIVAIFSIYQTCPQGIMVHASRGLKSIEQVFQSGTLALEIGLPYGKFLEKTYGFKGVKRIPYTGGIANFLADKNFAQQCFVFAEPISAKNVGADPQTFLIADSGYNPYTGIIITRRDYLDHHMEIVKAMVKALQQGWTAYQHDPKPANLVMGQLNKNMDAATFAAAAEAQKPLVESADTAKIGLGVMTTARWDELIQQLVGLGFVTKPPHASDCFVDLIGNKAK